MSQRVVVLPDGNVRVVSAGPIGPAGPPGDGNAGGGCINVHVTITAPGGSDFIEEPQMMGPEIIVVIANQSDNSYNGVYRGAGGPGDPQLLVYDDALPSNDTLIVSTAFIDTDDNLALVMDPVHGESAMMSMVGPYVIANVSMFGIGAPVWLPVGVGIGGVENILSTYGAETPELLYDSYGVYEYFGRAPSGSLPTDPVWSVTRIETSFSGLVTVTTMHGIRWAERDGD